MKKKMKYFGLNYESIFKKHLSNTPETPEMKKWRASQVKKN